MVADSAINNLVSFAIIFAIARIYNDPGIVGQVNLLFAITAVAVLLGDSGNGLASTLLISRYQAKVGHVKPGESAAAGLLHAGFGGLIMAIIVFFLPDLVAAAACYANVADRAEMIGQVRPQVRLIALWVVAGTLMQQTAGTFNGLQRMGLTLLQDILTHVPRLGLCLMIGLTGQMWQVMITAWTFVYLAAATAALLLLLSTLRRAGCPLSLAGYHPLTRLRTGAVLFTPLAAGFIMQYLAYAVIWWMSPPSRAFESLGFFAPLWTLTRAYEVLLWPIAIVLLPAVSDAHGMRDPLVLTSLVRRALVVTGLAAVGVLLLITAAPKLLIGLYGAAYADAYETLRLPLVILAFGVAFESHRCAFDPVLNGSGLARWVTAIEWGKFALLLVLGIPLYRAYALDGIAVAFAGAFLPAFVAKLLLIWFGLRIRVLGHAGLVAAVLTSVFLGGLFLHYVL
jgi:O-antigen/teichoic acid export membrane protein